MSSRSTKITRKEVDRIRGDFPMLAVEMNGKPLVYLDSAATSQKPRVMIDRLERLYSHEYARPQEGYSLSKDATKAFEGVRQQVARLINAADPAEIIFCRGATEATNLAARAVEHDRLGEGDEVLVTEAEHHSNIVPWLMACHAKGARVRAVPITSSGDLDLDRLEPMLNDRVRLLAVNHVSNVTGAVLPVEQATKLAHDRGIQVLVDGAQAVPHLPVDVRAIGCDLYAGSGHKMGGPSSVGFLYGRKDVLEALPTAEGGSMMVGNVTFDEFEPKPPPQKYEAGEPAFGEVTSWGPAIEYWQKLGLDRIAAYERAIAREAADALGQIERVRILGAPTDRIAVVSFTVDGMPAKDVEQALDREGIAVRAGTLESQPQLRALGTEEAVRASFSFYNTSDEVTQLATALSSIVA
ncbi:MAG TPA: aminotransferase class V-fold PLP-dependent enzyme [Candidatus Limnocylindrales bacterium]|nr:aminotransferase class V-fold PLP-dependent enzyme [Candidatus Limnocylindrales bacterium]